MRSVLDPFQLVVIAIAGWMNQHQQQVVDYLLQESIIPGSTLGGAGGAGIQATNPSINGTRPPESELFGLRRQIGKQQCR